MGSEPAQERPVAVTAIWKVRRWCSAAAKSLGRSQDARVSVTTTNASHDVGERPAEGG